MYCVGEAYGSVSGGCAENTWSVGECFGGAVSQGEGAGFDGAGL